MKTKLNVKTGKEPINPQKLMSILNEALCEEWLTYYQSWIGAILMEGPLKNEIKPELFIHATQELNHAMALKERIRQLGFAQEQNFSDHSKGARCQPPSNYYIESILINNLDNERRAIQRYQQIADYTFKKDHITYLLISKILDDELNHVKAIEDWLTAISKVKETKYSYKYSFS